MEFVDIAGLVAGASKGEGLGNQFLANIRETDAIAHVVLQLQQVYLSVNLEQVQSLYLVQWYRTESFQLQSLPLLMH